MKYRFFQKRLAKNLGVTPQEALKIERDFLQTIKEVILQKNIIEFENLFTLNLKYKRSVELYNPIRKKRVFSFPFRKITIKMHDRLRHFFNPHEDYVERKIFYKDKHIHTRNQKYAKEEYESFVKSFKEYKKLNLIDKITYEEYRLMKDEAKNE
jgi:hypothetical protein